MNFINKERLVFFLIYFLFQSQIDIRSLLTALSFYYSYLKEYVSCDWPPLTNPFIPFTNHSTPFVSQTTIYKKMR